jgi:RNA-directed DNA polymerase
MARTAKQDSVRELQRTLYRAAKADPGRRFHALYDKVYRRDVIEWAWELVRANKGAAGIDRQTIADVEEYGLAKLLDGLVADLKDGSYRPLAARRVFIPKPGSPTEQRPLSIPAVRDRIVQAALKTVIEPIFEADFLLCSFGFRPQRSQHDALQVLIDEAWDGRRWIAESDVSDCFGAIPHGGLMAAVEERIVDRHVLKLLRAPQPKRNAKPSKPSTTKSSAPNCRNGTRIPTFSTGSPTSADPHVMRSAQTASPLPRGPTSQRCA